MVGRIVAVNVVIQNLRVENFRPRRHKNVVDFIALPGPLEFVRGSDILYVRMQDAERINHRNRSLRFTAAGSLDSDLALEISYDRIILAGVKIARHHERFFILSVLDAFGQQNGTFFSGRLRNVVQVEVEDIERFARPGLDEPGPGADADTGVAPGVRAGYLRRIGEPKCPRFAYPESIRAI
jgi:hypothetical protein